jgi:hypothetical protein
LTGLKQKNVDPIKAEEVMTSSDFTYAITTYVSRLMLPAYNVIRFDFEQFLKIDPTAANFMPVDRYQQRAGVDDLEFVGEKGEPLAGHVDDVVPRRMRVYRLSKEYDFSMEAIINDDMGVFVDLATVMGLAARRTNEKHVSNWLWNAVTLARLVGLGANYATNGRLTTARVSAARMAFNQRTDARGEPIAAGLQYIVIHSGLADQAATILQSPLVAELATNAVNVVKFIPIEDPYAPGTAPVLPWMALCDYRMYNIIPFAELRRAAWPGPVIIRKKSDQEGVTSLLGAGYDLPPQLGDFSNGNVILKVEDQWGTYIDPTEGNLFDFRGAYYGSGVAP